MTQTTERNYKKTLNLPKTSFPMRANLAQNEPASLKRWEKEKLYDALQRERADAEPFVFHDGPPYANGKIHVGHLLNKVLKDFVVRSRLMMGHQCHYVPGWDCHGLPIEHKVMTDLVESGKIEKIKSLDDDTRRMAIRRACKTYAEKQIKTQMVQMKRLLTVADYDDPYLTMNARYERAVIDVFAEMVEQGLVYRQLKPVHWSIANQTALAEAELEYEDREDPSIYVDFAAEDGAAVADRFGVTLTDAPSFMIWTTTPWTLPANLAIAVHERFRYALVRLGDRLTVVATELLEDIAKKVGVESPEILAEVDGKALIGLTYQHPFCSRTGRIVAADYVTAEDGTGLVHTAPGHGADDYHTGLREGLEVYCPVQDDGTYDETVPAWLIGLSVWDANPKVMAHLRESGHMVHDYMFTHSYPHDWRSKTPVIFRGTEQWFVAVDKETKRENTTLRTMAQKAATETVQFIPEWGRNRLAGMLETRPDWCLSRQRSWGLPIPAFKRPDGEVFMTAASVRAVAEAFGARGSDAWFTESPADLLATYDAASDSEAPAGLDVNTLEKMYDIFDVWFESGSSWNAVMRQREIGYPVDLYLEGSDQHRGWFQLSLLPGLAATGEPPFKTLLTHGFMVDKDGKKMSKSLGNALDVDELLKHYGADVCRWWVSSISFEHDIKIDLSFFKEQASDSYRKVRNTLRFLASNLFDFVPCTADNPDGMCVDLKSLAPTSVDAWVMGEADRVQREVLDAYGAYDFRAAHQAIFNFCNETLSAVYCSTVKDRLYCDTPNSERRRITQTVMWDLLEMLSRLLAPLVPHTADEMYRSLWGDHRSGELCVHTATVMAMPEVSVSEHWPAVLDMRDLVMKAFDTAKSSQDLDDPMDAGASIPDPDGTLRAFEADLADLFGMSRVTFKDAGDVEIIDLRGEPRCERSKKRDGSVTERSDGGMLSDRDAAAVGV
ncbi:MAG: isoleucine--tRNA ligase [Planctomycetota bacterium]